MTGSNDLNQSIANLFSRLWCCFDTETGPFNGVITDEGGWTFGILITFVLNSAAIHVALSKVLKFECASLKS